jgi:hypothetical protein
MVDLGHEASVHAMQINFADEQANLWGKQTGIHHRFRVLCSNDKEHWSIALDRSKNNRDQPHAYFSLEKPITTRFLKLENIEVPTGCFAIQDFRVFGKRPTALPSTPADLKVERSQSDRRNVQLSWPKVEGAYAYAVEFGPSDDKLYSSFLVYGQEKYAMHSLNVDTPYCFRVSAVSESGVSPPGAVQMTP